ncbi:MAG: hypothetical protein LBB94_00235 [Clostridiales bacterium]|nr:hypothetical protein [Clostridiales bacterium]
MRKDIKIYNVLFPLWMLFFFPQMWLIVLPGNFIIDSIVLFIYMQLMKLQPKWDFYKKHILKIFALGLLADIVGSAFMFILALSGIDRLGDEPYLTIPALIISGVLIFVFNHRITFKHLDKRQRVRFSLAFAVFTAPYTFLVPSSWLYH